MAVTFFKDAPRRSASQDKLIYLWLSSRAGTAIVFGIIQAYVFLVVFSRCSERLHDKTVVAVLQAPVLFLDSNLVGRIMNRFAEDVGCLDEVLPKTFLMSLQLILLLLTGVIVPTVTNPGFCVLFFH